MVGLMMDPEIQYGPMEPPKDYIHVKKRNRPYKLLSGQRIKDVCTAKLVVCVRCAVIEK
jgi:hypothetical protein